MRTNRLFLSLAAPALALLAAIAFSALTLMLTGNSVLDVLEILWNQVTDIGELVSTVNRAAPYYVSGVAVAIGFKMNLFNIGVEGQYRLGGLVGAAAGASLPLPGPLRLVGIVVVAMAVGAAWAGIAGVLRAYRGVSEVISTIMLNAIALGLTPFLLTRYFADKGGAQSFTIRTELIPKGGRLPRLDFLVPGDAGRSHLSGYLVIAIVVGLVYWVLVWRSRFGFDLRASGANPQAARASGVDAKRMTVVALLISGAIAGMVGLSFVLSGSHRYTEESFLAGFGFTGIAIALLGRNNPVGIAFGALLWSFIDIARTPLSAAGLPREIATIVQGTIVLSVVIAYEVVRRLGQRWEATAIAQETAEPEPPPGGSAGEPAPAGVGA